MCSRHGVCNTTGNTEQEHECNPYLTYSEVVNCDCITSKIAWSVYPLKSRSEALIAGSVGMCHQFESSVERTYTDVRSVPKTLFCHDLKGGYLDDRFVNGSTKHDEYRFFHWAGIDIFVYFSHHFITIPPPMWITAAHLHGVKILGTVITEWKDGEAIWKQVLSSDEAVVLFADRLVDICSHFSFDGYLLNIENVIDKENIPRLEMFVRLLCTKLKEKVSYGEVIWYDSVTVNGNLKWQDELNDLNRTYFEHCDGIFLNYCWTDEKLKNSVKSAGSRKHDVYVGVDVFGRGCFGGGGFNTCKAMEVVRSHGLSVALFAPSWVHEYLGKEKFVMHEYVFWQKLWPFLYLHGPVELPFSTSFCQGFGSRMYHCGTVVSDTSWYHLGKQQYQASMASCLSDVCIAELCGKEGTQGEGNPNNEAGAEDLSQAERLGGCVQHHQLDGFIGGGCLEIRMPELCAERISKHTKQVLVFANETSNHIVQENETSVVRPLTENKVHQLNSSTELLTGSCGWIVRHYEVNITGTITKIGAELHGSCGSALLGYLSLCPLRPQPDSGVDECKKSGVLFEINYIGCYRKGKLNLDWLL